MSRGNVFSFIWKNMVKSVKPRQQIGTFVGEDYFGNRYFEIPIQKHSLKRRPERWYQPPGRTDYVNNFDTELTAEWESWLRHRRYDCIFGLNHLQLRHLEIF